MADAFTDGLLQNKTIIREYRPGDGSPELGDGRTPKYPWHVIGSAVHGVIYLPGVKSVVYDDEKITVTFDRKHPNVQLDLRPVIAPAIPPEQSLLKYKQGRLLIFFGQPTLGRQMQVEANAAVARFGINFDNWTDTQLVTGKGPGVGDSGLPVLPLTLPTFSL